MLTLVDATYSKHECKNFIIDFHGYVPDPVSDIEEYLSSDPYNHFETGSVIYRLLQLDGMAVLTFDEVYLTSDECSITASLLSSNDSSPHVLRIFNSTLQGGGQLIAAAIQHTTSLQDVELVCVSVDDSFWDSVISSVPQIFSMEKIWIRDDRQGKPLLMKLMKSIALQNNTIKSFLYEGSFLGISKKERFELEDVVKQNYTLEEIYVDEYNTLPIMSRLNLVGEKGSNPFRAITDLNKAGRKYLREDASSKENCIEVLGKVRNDLDCLYIHIRENPVLFTGNGNSRASSREETTNSKNVRLPVLLLYRRKQESTYSQAISWTRTHVLFSDVASPAGRPVAFSLIPLSSWPHCFALSISEKGIGKRERMQ